MSNPQSLETARLLLRPFTEEDLDVFHLLGSDPRIIRFTHDPGGGFADIEQARAILRSHPLADYQKHGYGRLACVLKSSDDVIGFCGLKHLEDLQEIDLGYRFLPEHWGQGLATEAGEACLRFGFEVLGLSRIIGLAVSENVASVRVLEKLGMTFEKHIEYDGVRPRLYSIHRGE